MKKFIISLMAMMLGVLGINAQTISVADATFKAGETKVVSINLNNSQSNIVSFQMDLSLPDGITINKAGCGLGSRITDNDQELTIGKLPNGDYRLTSTSFALKPISGRSGEIIKLSLTAASNAKGGTASLKNILFATSNSESLTAANISFKTDVTYTLTYKVDGKVYKTSTVVYGTAITPEANPTKEGYTFSGWSEIPATMPAHDVVVTGSFSINSYKLTYKVDGVVYKTSTVVYGTAITPEPAPTKEGYTFSGWSEIPATMPAHDVTVTGAFSINSYTLTYMLDGEVYKTMSVVYGTPLEEEPAPTKEGYTFSGWSPMPETMPARDVTVTGSFSINSYKLSYIVDGEVYKTYTLNYGTAIVPEAEPAKDGYTFSGWSEIPATMPAHDVVVIGSFIMNPPVITAKSYTIEYGDAIPVLEYEVEGELIGQPVLSCDATPTSSVGQYPIIVKRGTVSNDNVSFVNGTLTITPAPLTITAKSYTVSYGSPLPDFEATYTGFKNNETAEVLTKQPEFSCEASSYSEEGIYDIVVSGAEAENYSITYVNGKLTIVDETALNNFIYCADITARSGQQIELPIEITNDADLSIVGISFTLTLPDGVTIEENEDGEPAYNLVSSRLNPKRFTVYSAKYEDGSWGFRISTNNTTAVLNGTEGALMTITLNIADMSDGDYDISLTENKLSVRNNDNGIVSKVISDSVSKLTIKNVVMGDVNGDGEVDLSDAIMVTYYSLHVAPANFIEAAADMNGDGEIDLSDAIIIIYMSLGVR